MIKLKFFILLIFSLLFFSMPAEAKEYSYLYLIKNSQKDNLVSFTKAFLGQNDYKYFEQNGFYIPIKIEGNDFFHKILIKQNAQNSYYYILSDTKEDKLQKKLLKQIKKSGLKVKKIRNDELKELFYNDLNRLKKETQNEQEQEYLPEVFDFSDEAQARFDAQQNKYDGLTPQGHSKVVSENKNIWHENMYSPPSEVDDDLEQINKDENGTTIPFSGLRGQVLYIPKGQSITATLQSAINSQSVAQNDVITAVLAYDWVYKDVLVAPAGSILYGQVVDAKKAGYAYGNGSIEISFKELLTMDGQKFNLAANKVKLKSDVNRTVKVASQVTTGAILGVVSGVVYALISGGDVARGVAWGASVGGAGGLVRSGLQKGQNIEVPIGTNLKIEFTESMNVAPAY